MGRNWNQLTAVILKSILIFTAIFATVPVFSLDANEADTNNYQHGQIAPHPQHPKWLVRWDSLTHNHTQVMVGGPGDPEAFFWKSQRKEMIDRMIEHGGNCLYLMADASGDTPNASSYVGGNPNNGYDPSALDEWDALLTHADTNGIVILLFFYDDNKNYWGTRTTVHPEEEQNIKQLVERFAHLKNLIWSFAEESNEGGNDLRAADFANKVRKYDPHDHMMSIHTMHMSDQKYINSAAGIVAQTAALNHFVVQCNTSVDDDWHKCAVNCFKTFGPKVSINMGENTAPGRDDVWRKRMWAGTMGGGAVQMQLRTDIINAKQQELVDYRNHNKFFNATDFHLTSPHDELKNGATHYTLAGGDSVYIGYNVNATGDMGFKGMKIPQADNEVWNLTWYNCVTGESTIQENVTVTGADNTFPLPEGVSGEVALYARFHYIDPVIDHKMVAEPGFQLYKKSVLINGRAPELDGSDIQIYDIKGKEVKGLSGKTNSFDGLSNGIYFLKKNSK
ncbi:MAG: hypothetical protein HQK83_07465 [Fibrobacteria bacterium]|nr:hypothetical protein [Fibrobacteria bacterium]